MKKKIWLVANDSRTNPVYNLLAFRSWVEFGPCLEHTLHAALCTVFVDAEHLVSRNRTRFKCVCMLWTLVRYTYYLPWFTGLPNISWSY